MKTIGRYPIVFNSPSVDMGFIERVRPEAVDSTLRSGAEVVALMNHDSSMPLGRTSAGTLRLRKDHYGLLAALDVDEEVSFARDTLRIIERGDARGSSFAFTATDDVWSLQGGVPHRELLDMTIREISLAVAFPAYPGTAQREQARGMSMEMAKRWIRQWKAEQFDPKYLRRER